MLQETQIQPLEYSPTIRQCDIYTQMYLSNVMNNLISLMTIWTEGLDATERQFISYSYYARSARKIISPVMFDITNGGEPLPLVSINNNVGRDKVAKIIYSMFKHKWVMLWNAMFAEYSPISNYDMTETETTERNNEGGTSDTINITKTADETITDSGSNTNTGTITDSGTQHNIDGVWGFNSSASSDSQETEISDSNIRTNNISESTQNSRTVDNDESETHTNTGTHNDEMTETRTLQRSGNIGVTTSQQMIQSEIELRKTRYFDIVFEDIDSFMCLPIY